WSPRARVRVETGTRRYPRAPRLPGGRRAMSAACEVRAAPLSALRRPASVVALFIPDPAFAHLFRVGPGRSRAIAYALCRPCHAAPGAAEAAEERLEHRGRAA